MAAQDPPSSGQALTSCLAVSLTYIVLKKHLQIHMPLGSQLETSINITYMLHWQGKNFSGQSNQHILVIYSYFSYRILHSFK